MAKRKKKRKKKGLPKRRNPLVSVMIKRHARSERFTKWNEKRRGDARNHWSKEWE